ncbi:MAG: GTP-binding protein [Gammaproteobacteria bacterium]|nr:GTP-binding protein [Gammaproteobacteria bacterium]
MSTRREALPVNVLTGFLGSGKTSLLNRWLQDPALAGTAVLINEFGQIGLDHQLVDTLDGAPVLLANGCVCCAIREDLKEAILLLETRRLAGEIPAYRRILLETTGIADPAPILATLLNDPELRHHVRPGLVVTTVDAVNGHADLMARRELAQQVAAADVLVLTKTDLVPSADLQALAAALEALNSEADMLPASEAEATLLLTADSRMGSAHSRRRAGSASPHAHSHGTKGIHAHELPYRATAFFLDEALDWTSFGLWLSMLLHTHGRRILRVKGLLGIAGTDTPVVINGVQHLVHPPYHLPAWPDGDDRSRLVFTTDGLDPAVIKDSLQVFNRAAQRLRLAADSSP